jgi:hypothetical protein
MARGEGGIPGVHDTNDEYPLAKLLCHRRQAWGEEGAGTASGALERHEQRPGIGEETAELAPMDLERRDP